MNIVAQTILNQLGANRFVTMTGAKNFVYGENNLTFSIDRGAKNKSNKVRITLTTTDEYRIEFFNVRGIDFKTIKEVSGIYADRLREVFTNETGMVCSL